MGDEDLSKRIAAWQAAGLIDAATAQGLIAFENEEGSAATVGLRRPVLASFFGPAVSVGEMLGYLGAAFLLAAWHVFVNASSGSYGGVEDFGREALQFGGPAVLLATLGLFLVGGSDRESRAAGVALVGATIYVGIAAWFAIQAIRPIERDLLLVLVAVVAVVTAGAFRRVHPGVLTELGLLGALWTLAAAGLTWLDRIVYPVPDAFDTSAVLQADSGTALVRLILTAAWWLGWAVALGLLAMFEARAAAELAGSLEGAATDRRAAVGRFVAGLVAVSGMTFAVMQSNGFERVLSPWLGDLAILAVTGVLVVVAFRRGASAYLYPAAIGLIAALSDINASYVASTSGTASALLLEGLILLAAGFGADRLRRRLEQAGANAVSPDASVAPEHVTSA